MTQWHALYVNSRAEKKVGEALNQAQIEAYVPIVKTMRQWSDRKKMVEMPLINGYVFVKAGTSQHERVLQVRGVVAFVKSEGRIAVVRSSEIESLKQLVELGYHLEAGGIEHEYSEGDRIRISSGPLKGIEGFILGSGPSPHLEILLESIGQCIRVKLPRGMIAPLDTKNQ